jgi:ribonuclease-3
MSESDNQGINELRLNEIYHFRSSYWLELAMTHKSFSNERKTLEPAAATLVLGTPIVQQTGIDDSNLPDDNERLEFLGDAVLCASLSARLMREFPADPEGTLSKKRASLVNEERLAEIARRLKLEDMIKLGKGEIKTGGASKPRILACGLEALIGAIFMDSGFMEADRTIGWLFKDEIESVRSSNVDFERDYKTRLQEQCHVRHGMTPTYEVTAEFGPAHAREFRVVVKVQEHELGAGEGRSKKAAEQDAAKSALNKIYDLNLNPDLSQNSNHGSNKQASKQSKDGPA